MNKRNEAATCSERRNANAFHETRRKNGSYAIQGTLALPDGIKSHFDAGWTPEQYWIYRMANGM